MSKLCSFHGVSWSGKTAGQGVCDRYIGQAEWLINLNCDLPDSRMDACVEFDLMIWHIYSEFHMWVYESHVSPPGVTVDCGRLPWWFIHLETPSVGCFGFRAPTGWNSWLKFQPLHVTKKSHVICNSISTCSNISCDEVSRPAQESMRETLLYTCATKSSIHAFTKPMWCHDETINMQYFVLNTWKSQRTQCHLQRSINHSNDDL